jgi:hypothetical protein
MLIVVRQGHRVLFPDSTEAGQFRGEILADRDGRRDEHGAEAVGIVDKGDTDTFGPVMKCGWMFTLTSSGATWSQYWRVSPTTEIAGVMM